MADGAHPATPDPRPLEDQLAELDHLDLLLLEWELSWKEKARPNQLPQDSDWASWGAMAGRGYGKTVLAAHWLGVQAARDPGSFNAVIAPTLDDVRYTCFEGPTGILSLMPEELVADYNKSSLIIYLSNGAIIRGFGTERPERLRGPQHHRCWGDEAAAWQNARMVYDMMKFGLRLGSNPQFLWTTTPKPVPLIRELVKEAEESEKKEDGKHLIVRGTTYENKANLAPTFYDEVAKYEGTRIGRQELEGELIDPEEEGIIKRSQWRQWPSDKPLPAFNFVLMSLDTAYTERTYDRKTMEADPTACEVWGLFIHKKKMCVMLLDAWEDYLALPELVKRVREERAITYGEIDMPLVGKPYVPNPNEPADGVKVGKGVDLLLVEDKGSGISLRQTLGMENILMEPYNPGRADKLARVHSITPMFAHGRVWAIESNKRPGEFRTWAESVIGQVCSYHGPGTTDHDDYVDACTQALKYFMNKFIGSFTKDEDVVEDTSSERPLDEAAIHPTGINPYLQ